MGAPDVVLIVVLITAPVAVILFVAVRMSRAARKRSRGVPPVGDRPPAVSRRREARAGDDGVPDEANGGREDGRG